MTNPKYTLYVWSTNDEGGYAVCHVDEFASKHNGNLQIEHLGNFNTTNELAKMLYADDPDWFADEGLALYYATEMMEEFTN